jgi:cysteinyl-tRNA synthetase
VASDDLRSMLDLFGLANLLDREAVEAPPRALTLVAEREQARARRDFEAADRLRDELRELGWAVRDGPDGPELLPL